MKNLLLIPFLLLLTINCKNGNQPVKNKKSVNQTATRDSIIFTMNQPNFKATLSEVNFTGKGSAKGKTLFQRVGSIQYIIRQLYKGHPVLFENAPYLRRNFKITINWSSKTDFNAIRSKVLPKMEEALGYTIKTDRVTQKVYQLSVVDPSKLEKNAHIILNGTAIKYYSSEYINGIWNITATLPKFSEALSERTKLQVQANLKNNLFYHFELDMKKGRSELKKQLKQKYGLALESSRQPVKRIKIIFNKK